MKRRASFIAFLLALLFLVLALPRGGSGETSQRHLDALAKASLIYIATARKDGNQSTAVPVWFTAAADRSILIQTGPKTWKARRIGRGSPVIVWIDDQKGPAFVGKAEITTDAKVVQQIVDDFPKRYMMARLGIHKPTLESFEKGERIAIRITPLRDLPEGFASEPGKPLPK